MTDTEPTRDPATSDAPQPNIPPRPGLSPDVPLHAKGDQPHEPVTSDAPEPATPHRPGLSPDVPLHERHRGSTD